MTFCFIQTIFQRKVTTGTNYKNFFITLLMLLNILDVNHSFNMLFICQKCPSDVYLYSCLVFLPIIIFLSSSDLILCIHFTTLSFILANDLHIPNLTNVSPSSALNVHLTLSLWTLTRNTLPYSVKNCTLYSSTIHTFQLNFNLYLLCFLSTWIFYVFVLSYVCYVFVHVCLYMLCGHLLGQGSPLGSRLRCLTVSL